MLHVLWRALLYAHQLLEVWFYLMSPVADHDALKLISNPIFCNHHSSSLQACALAWRGQRAKCSSMTNLFMVCCKNYEPLLSVFLFCVYYTSIAIVACGKKYKSISCLEIFLISQTTLLKEWIYATLEKYYSSESTFNLTRPVFLLNVRRRVYLSHQQGAQIANIWHRSVSRVSPRRAPLCTCKEEESLDASVELGRLLSLERNRTFQVSSRKARSISIRNGAFDSTDLLRSVEPPSR